MWNSLVQFPNRKGFTLIELIIGIALASVVLTTIFTLFGFTNKSLITSEKNDNIYLNGQYGLEYIKGEVLAADRIVPSYKFKDLNKKFSDNIGFVIVVNEKSYNRFITYHKGDGNLIRVACEDGNTEYPDARKFKGYNQVCTNLVSLDNTKLDIDNKLLNLHLDMGIGEEYIMDFKTTIYIRCPIDI